MKNILFLTIIFLGLLIAPKHSKAQDTTITRLEPKQLLVGIDIVMLAVAKLRTVPLTVRYGISDKVIGVLSLGYADFYMDSINGSKAANYRSKGFYISAGADYVLKNNKKLEGNWCVGASFIFSKTAESMIYTFKLLIFIISITT